MKDLKAVKGTYYIRKLIEEGEHETQDFKFAISDARKIARSLSAFANHRGGRLLVGVKDNGVIAGIRNEEDIYVMEQAAELYCRPAQSLRFTTFVCDNGLIVLRVEIDPSKQRPVMASEPDGTWKAWFRVADENIAAPKLMVDSWRSRNSHTGGLLTIGPLENSLLSMIRSNPAGVALRDFMLAVHCSQIQAENIVRNLYAMDVVDFRYDGHNFLIAESDGDRQPEK